MNHYEKVVNSFLSSVSSNMSAVYLPVLLISLINLLEDYFKFDRGEIRPYIEECQGALYISLVLTTGYFLNYLIDIRRSIPEIRLTPVKGKSHEERFLEGFDIRTITGIDSALSDRNYISKIGRITRDMMDSQNVYPVFERRCPIFRLQKDRIEMNLAAIETLLQNSILYTKMAEMICLQYLMRLSDNRHLISHLENYFIRRNERDNFSRADLIYVLEYQEQRCFYCNRQVQRRGQGGAKPEADHFVPWVFVKSSQVENLVLACHDCNSEKLDRLPAVNFFNRLLRRNDPGSDFWAHYPRSIPDLEERVERWVKHYYLASEQLSTGWKPVVRA